MANQFERTELLIGKEGIDRLKAAKVAVFGMGGVGSYVLEGLARAGVGNFILVDDDKVDITNINRQIIATHKTVGRPKVEVAKERILEINPDANVEIYEEFFMPTSRDIVDESVDYVVDAIDTITAKVDIAVRAQNLNIPCISSMGAGNKMDPTKFEVADIYQTSVCPLAKVMRKMLKNKGVGKLKVVYSKEEAIKPKTTSEGCGGNCGKKAQAPGSISFVPSVVGLIIAGEVVKDLIQ